MTEISYGELEKQLKFIDINKDLSMRYDIKTAVMITHYDTFKELPEYRKELEHNYSMCYAFGNRKYTEFMRETFYKGTFYKDMYKNN